MQTRYMHAVILYLYVCVCLSVSHMLVSKRLNLGSCKHHMIAQRLQFPDAKDFAGATNAGGIDYNRQMDYF